MTSHEARPPYLSDEFKKTWGDLSEIEQAHAAALDLIEAALARYGITDPESLPDAVKSELVAQLAELKVSVKLGDEDV